VGRPNKAASFRALVDELLTLHPRATTSELLARAQQAGYAGGKTAFYALVASARQGYDAEAVAAAPGERSHHDLGEADVSYVGGGRRRVRFLVSRLAYSGWVAASVVDDDAAETVARALVDHFAAMGGVPLVARFERPKPVATAWTPRGRAVRWNIAFAYLAAELGVGLEVRPPRTLSRRIKEEVISGRVFEGPSEIAARLAAWCYDVDEQRPSDARNAPYATPATLMTEERRRLRPLAVAPADLEICEPVFIGAGGATVHGARVYAMPAAAAGRIGIIGLGREHVRIVAGEFEAVHRREPEPQRQHDPEDAASDDD
jgi:hypothetical protein